MFGLRRFATPFTIGECVELFSGGIPGFGGLNSLFLSMERYYGGLLSVLDTKDEGTTAVVQLPSGYRLDITRRDVLPNF